MNSIQQDDERRSPARNRKILWAAATTCTVLVSLFSIGCSGWHKRDGERKGPFSWMSTVILPPGESFYSERSREIERSLNTNLEQGGLTD